MLKVKATTVGLVIWYRIAISGKPGAITELASGEINEYRETYEEEKN